MHEFTSVQIFTLCERENIGLDPYAPQTQNVEIMLNISNEGDNSSRFSAKQTQI